MTKNTVMIASKIFPATPSIYPRATPKIVPIITANRLASNVSEITDLEPWTIC